MKFCPECGKSRKDKARFCYYCGLAYPGASRQVIALGLSTVIFLSGLTYALIYRVIVPQLDKQTSNVIAHQPAPDHDHDHQTQTDAGQETNDHASGAQNTRFAQLEQFFLEHQVIGPKVFTFKVESENLAILYLDQFPMDQMPPNMRASFDERVRNQMAYLGEGVRLEIRDARDRQVLSDYQN